MIDSGFISVSPFSFVELCLSISKEYLVATEVLLRILLGLFGTENFSLVGFEHSIEPKFNLPGFVSLNPFLIRSGLVV